MFRSLKIMVLMVLSVSVFSLAGFANNKRGNDAVIKGSFDKFHPGQVVLYKASNGQRVKCASVEKDEGNEFGFVVPVQEEGLYYLSDQSKWWYVRLYLKPGDNVEVRITYPGYYEIVSGSEENKMLQKWFDKVCSVTLAAFDLSDTTDHVTFFNREKELKNVPTEFRKSISTPNPAFNAILKDIVDVDLDYAALRFCFTPRRHYPTTEQFVAYLKQYAHPGEFPHASLLKLGEASDILSLYYNAMHTIAHYSVDSIAAYKRTLADYCNFISNDTLKGAFAISQFPYYQFADDVKREILPVEKYMITDAQKAAFAKKIAEVDPKLAKGNPAFDFELSDPSGKKLKMSDFKGKVVFIDVWATWCGPCKEQFPYLKSVEEAYKGKNIEFVTISSDKDVEKWKQFVQDNHMTGVQLNTAGAENPFMRYYQINTIPRFLVIDKEGKIISANSPRPSEPGLKELLDNALK